MLVHNILLTALINDVYQIMNYIDISWPITPTMTAYKDRSVVRIEHTKTFECDGARESQLVLGAHTGTHIDAPAHFMRDGKTIDQQALTATIGPCVVLDMMHCTAAITADDLVPHQATLRSGEIVLFKTRNSLYAATDPFNAAFIYVAADAAQWLVAHNIKAVGIDYLGIERNQPAHETHTTFMQAGVTIIEGLRLAHVTPGEYFLWCLPLAVVGAEAAPARAVLLQR